MWVKFDPKAQWIFEQELSRPFSLAQGIHVWKVSQQSQLYIIKWIAVTASDEIKKQHQREISHYKQLNGQQISLDFQVLEVSTLVCKVLEKNAILSDKEVLILPFIDQSRFLNSCKMDFQLKMSHFIMMCEVLDRLHKQGYVHGDLKLSHFIEYHTDYRLVDLAQIQSIESNMGVKEQGGTPAYMAPELFLGQAKSVQSDIYALGILFYVLLTGIKPFQNDTYQQWAVAHCQQMIPLLPKEYQDYQDVLDKMLAKHKKNRFLSVQQLINALNLIKKS